MSWRTTICVSHLSRAQHLLEASPVDFQACAMPQTICATPHLGLTRCRRFAGEAGDDRRMEVGWAGVQAEERRSARAGRDDDAAAEALERAQRVGI